MAKILLVSPPVYDFKLYDQWMNPFGLMALSYLIKKAGHKVVFIDGLYARRKTKKFGTGFFVKKEVSLPEPLKFMQRPYYRFGKPQEDFIKAIKEAQFDVAFVNGFLTYWYLGVFETINLLKKFHPQKPVVLGGIYPTLCPQHAKTFSKADIIFTGQASPKNLKALFNNLGLSWNIKDFQLGLDLSLVQEKPFFSLLLSSGCPYQCHYCASSVLTSQHGLYTLPPTSFFKQGYQKGIKDLAFLDDALLYYQKDLQNFIYSLQDQGVFFRYHTPNGLHLNQISQETAQFLKKTNFETLRFGLESLETQWLLKSQNKTSQDQLFNSIAFLKEAGFKKKQVGIYLLLSPESSLKETEKTLLLLEKMQVNLHLNHYSPIPQTKDFNLMAQKYPEIIDEPLLQNESVFLKKTGTFSPAHLYKLKKRIQTYNSLEER